MLNAILDVFIPGTMSFLVIAVIAGVITMGAVPRLRRAARVWIAVWAAIYTALSLPVVAVKIVGGLAGQYAPLTSPDHARDAGAIIVLAADSELYQFGPERVPLMSSTAERRVLEAARLYRLLGDPLVIVSGTDDPAQGPNAAIPRAMGAGLIAAGVPRDRIAYEIASTNTYGAAVALRRTLGQRGLQRAVLVTSADHMRRAHLSALAAGLDVIPSPAPTLPLMPWNWGMFVPDIRATAISQESLHEYIGLAYYYMRGWI